MSKNEFLDILKSLSNIDLIKEEIIFQVFEDTDGTVNI